MEEQRWLRQVSRDLEGAQDSLTTKHYENEIPSDYYSQGDAAQCISYAESILSIVSKFMSS